jgi:hypothetical protein
MEELQEDPLRPAHVLVVRRGQLSRPEHTEVWEIVK